MQRKERKKNNLQYFTDAFFWPDEKQNDLNHDIRESNFFSVDWAKRDKTLRHA